LEVQSPPTVDTSQKSQPSPLTLLSQPIVGTTTPNVAALLVPEAAVEAVPAPIQHDPPGTVSITLGQGDQAKIALMPTKGVRPEGGQTVEETIRQKVNEGRQVYERILNGDYDNTPQTNKVETAKLMWYLQALGSAKALESSGGGPGTALFKEGAFMVEDPQGKLQAYLENSNSYSRSSSHMRDFQNQGPDFKARGVDIRGVSMPNGRKTILFQKVPQEQPTSKKMLFVKMEPYGCRGLTCRGSGTPRDHETPSSLWKGVKRFFLNTKDFIMHGLGFMDSVLQRAGLMAIEGQNNRERIPSGLSTSYQALLNRFPEGDASPAYKILNESNPLSDSRGIKVMHKNLNDLLTSTNFNTDLDDDLKAQVQQLFDTIDTHGDHLDLRIGSEIILTQNDLNQLMPLQNG
jgi:hypothetical protein